MAIAVIDDFEIIDVNEKDGSGRVRMPFHPIHDALQSSQEQGPIGKASEHIVGSVKKQFFLSVFPFCYISGVVNDAADILVLKQVSNNTLEIEPPSVCMLQPELNYHILFS